MNANRVCTDLVLHVVSLNVEFGDGVHRSPVDNGGVNGVVSQTVKQSGYPKYNVFGLVGSPTTFSSYFGQGYSNEVLQLDYLLILSCRYVPNCRQNS